MLYVGCKSVVPLPDPPAGYALVFFIAYIALGGGLLAYSKVEGHVEWLGRAGLATKETHGGAATSVAAK